MSLAAIPAYLIARRLMRPSLALLAAVFAVSIPSLAYTNTLLTENAFYPASMAAAAALFLLLERPTLTRQISFFGFVDLAFLIRAQGVILLAALAGSLVLMVVLNAWNGGRLDAAGAGPAGRALPRLDRHARPRRRRRGRLRACEGPPDPLGARDLLERNGHAAPNRGDVALDARAPRRVRPLPRRDPVRGDDHHDRTRAAPVRALRCAARVRGREPPAGRRLRPDRLRSTRPIQKAPASRSATCSTSRRCS